MNFNEKIRYIDKPKLHLKDDGTIDFAKTTYAELESYSVLFNKGFEFSNHHYGFEIIQLPSRVEDC